MGFDLCRGLKKLPAESFLNEISTGNYCFILYSLISAKLLVFNQTVSCHLLGLFDAHDVEDGRSNVGKYAGLNLCGLVFGNVDEKPCWECRRG